MAQQIYTCSSEKLLNKWLTHARAVDLRQHIILGAVWLLSKVCFIPHTFSESRATLAKIWTFSQAKLNY